MRFIKYTPWICAGVLFVTSITPAWGILNNGFETDYVYLLRWSGTPSQSTIRRNLESDGTEVGGGAERWQAGQDWATLTFSEGATARLFVAKGSGTDITIGEVDSNGALLRSVALSTIIGGSPSTDTFGNMRYNRMHNSLIVSARATAGTSAVGKAWEIDLGLGSLLHTYVGSSVPDARPVDVAFNENTGALYMVSRNLGEASATTMGDLIAFDTLSRLEGGVTTSYSTLVDGPTKQGLPDPSDADWKNPSTVIYRQRPGGDDTVLTGQQGTTGLQSRNLMEHYVNTDLHAPDSEGNLILRGKPFQVKNFQNGQQDPYSGDVWMATWYGGWFGLHPDDTYVQYDAAVNGTQDLDSPIPEPGALSLLALGGLGLLIRRRPM